MILSTNQADNVIWVVLQVGVEFNGNIGSVSSGREKAASNCRTQPGIDFMLDYSVGAALAGKLVGVIC